MYNYVILFHNLVTNYFLVLFLSDFRNRRSNFFILFGRLIYLKIYHKFLMATPLFFFNNALSHLQLPTQMLVT